MEKITSAQNSRIKAYAKLHTRKEREHTGLFLIEGEHLLEEAEKENMVETVLTDTPDQYQLKNMIEVTPEIMKKLSSNVSAIHLIGVCHKKQMKIEAPHRLLLLDDIQDPGNFGTLIRTAVSFGFDGVVCSRDTVDLYNEKTIRSTQNKYYFSGRLFRLLLKCGIFIFQKRNECLRIEEFFRQAIAELNRDMSVILSGDFAFAKFRVNDLFPCHSILLPHRNAVHSDG